MFRDVGVTHELIAQAREHGFGALVLTVDAPVRGNRERDVRTGFAIPDGITIPALGRGGVRVPEHVGQARRGKFREVRDRQVALHLGQPLVVAGQLQRRAVRGSLPPPAQGHTERLCQRASDRAGEQHERDDPGIGRPVSVDRVEKRLEP